MGRLVRVTGEHDVGSTPRRLDARFCSRRDFEVGIGGIEKEGGPGRRGEKIAATAFGAKPVSRQIGGGGMHTDPIEMNPTHDRVHLLIST
jgi:hypothetical protein